MKNTAQFKNYKKNVLKAFKIINSELKRPDTNFNNILINLELLEGQTKNFI